MEYNFSSMSVDALADIEKRLQKIKQNILDDINNFIRILNDEAINKRTGELNTVICDLFNDEIKKSIISYTGCLNKVQASLRQYL